MSQSSRIRQHRILFLFSGKITESQILYALAQLDQIVEIIDLNRFFNQQTKPEDLLVLLVEKKHTFDFILTVNSYGLDDQGVIAERLLAERIHLVSWELDHPYIFNLLGLRKNVASDYTTLFLWDEGYLEDMKAMGFDRVHYLPNASCARQFAIPPAQAAAFNGDQYRGATTFVGMTMLNFITRFAPVLGCDLFPTADHKAVLESCTKLLLQDTSLWFHRAFQLACENLNIFDLNFQSNSQREKYLAFAEMIVSSDYRIAVLRALKDVLIFGDLDEWKMVLPQHRLMGKIDYQQEVKHLFANSAINLNITLIKNRWDANLRIYDIPLAGGFVLSDARKNIARHFELDKEIVVYHSIDDLQEKRAKYQHDHALRQRIVTAAKKRIASEHLYQHRLTELICVMQGYLA